MDCGGTFPTFCMDFDHRDPEAKSYNIGAKMKGAYSPEAKQAVETEIAKCDLVCSNCHRIRTNSRGRRRKRRTPETLKANT